jgi:hypothetical protein
MGEAFVIDSGNDSAWKYEAISFQAISGTIEFPCDRPNPDVNQNGNVDFDGIEYERFPEELAIPNFLEQRPPVIDSRLVLLSTAGPDYTAELELLVHNNSEEVFSVGHRFECWDSSSLAEIAPITTHLMGDPDETGHNTEAGWIRIRGKFLVDSTGTVVRYPGTNEIVPVPMLGVFMERISVGCGLAGGDPLRFLGGKIDGLQLPYFENLP